METNKSSGIISKVLSPALRLLLRSQVEQIEELQIQIQGRDRQILGGYIPGVSLNSRQAVYQGLHLRNVHLNGENIRINIGQVLKGKPLQLLEPIQMSAEVCLQENDLQASLTSPTLANALTELLIVLLEMNGISHLNQFSENYQVSWQEITLNPDKFTLIGTLIDQQGKTNSIHIRAGLVLMNSHMLNLAPIHLEVLPDLLTNSITDYQVDLGTDVELQSLKLTDGQLFCSGHLVIRP